MSFLNFGIFTTKSFHYFCSISDWIFSTR